MSIYAIQQHNKELEKIIHYGGIKTKGILNSFYNLLNKYVHCKDLMLLPKIFTKNKSGKLIPSTEL